MRPAHDTDPPLMDYAHPPDDPWTEPAHWSTVVLGTILALLVAGAILLWIVAFRLFGRS